VCETINRNGKVLLPVLGVGRAQEIMVLLDEAWKGGYLKNFKCYIDGMIWDATAIYTAYPEFLSRRVRNLIFKEDYNPFLSEIFHRVPSHEERLNVIKGDEPGVILATSGMLTGGPSVEYLKGLADSKKHSLIFVSYQAEGTLGKRIQKGWTKIPVTNSEGKLEEISIDMNVFTVEGFSGHSDRRQLIAYVMNSKPRPERVIIGHGEGSKSMELANGLRRAGKIETVSPQNLECMRLR
jgi:predicted metal-dependent RNase